MLQCLGIFITNGKWKSLTKLELEWVLADAKEQHKKRLVGVAPRMIGDDGGPAAELNAFWDELERKMNNLISPPLLKISPAKPLVEAFDVSCKLPECGVRFKTSHPFTKFCCDAHRERFWSREGYNRRKDRTGKSD